MKYSLIVAVVVLALAQGSLAQEAELDQISQYFEDMKEKMTKLFSNPDLASHAQNLQTQLEPLASSLQEQLRSVVSSMGEQVKPMTTSVQDQVRPVFENLQKQLAAIVERVKERTSGN